MSAPTLFGYPLKLAAGDVDITSALARDTGHAWSSYFVIDPVRASELLHRHEENPTTQPPQPKLAESIRLVRGGGILRDAAVEDAAGNELCRLPISGVTRFDEANELGTAEIRLHGFRVKDNDGRD